MAVSSSILSKNVLRAAALERRDSLSDAQRDAASRAIAARAFPVDVSVGAIVAGYRPIRGELDPTPLMARLSAQGAQLALPVIAARDAPLVFRVWTIGEGLVRGQFGILEPPSGAPVVTPDIVLVPLAAFDRFGNRIGYGAGYYDRTFPQLRRHKAVIAIGISFATQEISAIPADGHDARLDYVLTETDMLDFRSL